MTVPQFSFDNGDGKGRHYLIPGRDSAVPSITNIMKRQNKPAINNSAVRKVAEYAVENRERFAMLTPDEQVRLIKESQWARSEATVIGDIVHEWIDRYVKGDAPTHDEVKQSHQTAQWMWDRFIRFTQSDYRPKFIASEFTVWSDKHGYAGTGDLWMEVAGYNVLADTKTGKGVYPETGMQLAALANADIWLTDDGGEAPVPSYDRFAVLHIRPRSFTLYPVEKIPEAFECFLALKRVFEWEIRDAPETVRFSPKHN